MPVSPGAPFVFQELIDLVAASYPEYSPLLDPDQTGAPLLFDPASAVPGEMAAGIFIAMICPPNMTVRPATIGAFSLSITLPSVGIGAEFAVDHPIVAPDVFVEFTSATFPASLGNGGAAQGDMNLQIDAYRAANPNVRVLGTLISMYQDLGPPDPLFFVTGKLAGKLIA